MVRTWEEAGLHVNGSTSGQIYTTCPQCSHTRKKQHVKCLGINLDEEIWHCMHCDWSGGLDKGERRGLPPVAKVWKQPRPYPAKPTESWLLKWFAKRGIPAEVVLRHKISVRHVYFRDLEEEADGIAFPYYDGDRHVNTKYITYRNNEKHCTADTGCERIFYDIDAIHGDTVYITEGEVDKLSLEVAEYLSVVSVPDGAPDVKARTFTTKFTFVEHALDPQHNRFEGVKKIVLAVDTDPPGQLLAEELARRLGPERCWRVRWTEGCKDANEVLMQHGVDEVRQCVESATPWPIKGIITIAQLMPALDAMYVNGIQRGVHPGWESLAEYYRPKEGELTIVGGQPSHGKTRWLSHLVLNLAQQHGWKFALFSPEAKPERFIKTMLEQYVGKPFDDMPGRMSQPELWEAEAWLHEHVSLLAPEDAETTIADMLELARLQVTPQGIKGIVFDPWSWVTKTPDRGQLLTHYVAEQIKLIKHFCGRYDCHLWLVAHPTKLRKAETGEYAGLIGPPTLYDISDSAHFANGADMGVCVWRNTETNDPETKILIQKVRNEENGQTGTVSLVYDHFTKRYYDPGTQPFAYQL